MCKQLTVLVTTTKWQPLELRTEPVLSKCYSEYSEQSHVHNSLHNYYEAVPEHSIPLLQYLPHVVIQVSIGNPVKPDQEFNIAPNTIKGVLEGQQFIWNRQTDGSFEAVIAVHQVGANDAPASEKVVCCFFYCCSSGYFSCSKQIMNDLQSCIL